MYFVLWIIIQQRHREGEERKCSGIKLLLNYKIKYTFISIFRHRAVNLFLQGYEKSWVETEDHYFEDTLIEDLAVCLEVFGMGT